MDFSSPTPVYQPVAGTRSGGHFVEGARTLETFDLCIEPMSKGELAQVNQRNGFHAQGGICVFSDEELKVISVGDQKTGAWVVWNSKVYEVISGGDWPDSELGHWEHEAVLMDPQPTLPS